MKKLLFLSAILFASVLANAATNWTKESNFPGVARDNGASFSIGNYGFIGCGSNGSSSFNDFYKWNQSTNTWSTIASYPGAGYGVQPISFAVEGKGYVGLGYINGVVKSDLWQYDTGANSWTQKASFPGTARYDASWFVLGHKVYVVGGSSGGPPYLNDVWVYDTHANTWKQLNNSPASETDAMAAFAIGNKGYIVGGWNGNNGQTAGWSYDSTNDSWTSIANWPLSNGMDNARVFVVGSKAFVSNGYVVGTHPLPTGYVYDTLTKSWLEFTNMGANGIERSYSAAFSIGNYGYIGTGVDSTGAYLNDFYQYTPAICTLHASFTDSIGNNGQVIFTNTSSGTTAGTKYLWNAGDGYGTATSPEFTYNYLTNGTYTVSLIITDSVGGCSSDTSIVMAVSNVVPPTCSSWTKESNFPGVARDNGASFSIGNYGFIGCGSNGSSSFNDFYKWNQSTNTWSTIASYPGAGYGVQPISFAVEGKGYVGLGYINGVVKSDLWQYDTGANSWTQKASFPGTARYDASWFVLGHKVYVVGGSSGGPPYLNDVWVYDTHANTWKQLNNSPASETDAMAAFAIGNKGYIVGGWNGNNGQTAGWSYDSTNDSWTPIANWPLSNGMDNARVFVVGSRAFVSNGYVVGTHPLPTGYVYDTITKSWLEFTNMGANGIERSYSAAFTIGNYGYIGTGVDSTGAYLNDFRQYYPCADTAKLPICLLHASFTDSIGNDGKVIYNNTSSGTTAGTKYLWNAGDGKGTGTNRSFSYNYLGNGTYTVNLIITDSVGGCSSDTSIIVSVSNVMVPTCSIWSQKANLPGVARDNGAAFSIGNYGFIGCGSDGSSSYNDFYKWNQSTNTWSTIASYPGAGYGIQPISFAVEGKGYVGLGYIGGVVKSDLWQYDTGANSWTQKASLPGAARYDASWFVLGHKVYVIGGSAGGPPYLNDAWVYDTHTNIWKQLHNSPAIGTDAMSAFTIGNKGYIVGGWNGISGQTAAWSYDSTNDSWTPIASWPLSNGVDDSRAFVIGGRAYVSTGFGSYSTTLPVGYVYDTTSKAWSEFTNMGANGIERSYSTAFTIGNYGYIGIGVDSTGTDLNTFWQYTPCDTVLPPACSLVAGFSSNLGSNGQVTYTSTTSGATSSTKYTWNAGDGKGNGTGSSFTYTYLNNGTYLVNLVATDSNGSCASNASVYVTITTASLCSLHSNFSSIVGSNGEVAFISSSKGVGAGTEYYWNAGNNSGGGNGSSFIYTYPYNGTYGVNLFISDSSSSCSSDTTIYITISNASSCSLYADFSYTMGSNGEVSFNNTSTGMTSTTQVYWYAGDSVGYGYGNPYSYTYQKNGTYPVTLYLSNTTAGCSSDTTIMVTVSNANNTASTCTLGVILKSSKASCDSCSDGGATVTATGGSGTYSYHWSNGATTTSIAASPGIYTCCVTDANGCSACANTTVSDSCLYAEFTYTVKYNTAGDSATISFVSISDTVCNDSTHGPTKPQKSVSYTWNFGDGNSQTISGIGVRTTNHTFSTSNGYNITLAINREGSQVKSIAIKPVKLVNQGIPTGIASLSNASGLKLFPNPNTGSFLVAIDGVSDNQEAELQITNLLGEVVYTTSTHSSNGILRKEIDLANVSSGTYFIKVITVSKVYVSKVLITR